MTNEQLAKIVNGAAAEGALAARHHLSQEPNKMDAALALAELERRFGVKSVYQSRAACELLDANRGSNPVGVGWMFIRRTGYGYRD